MGCFNSKEDQKPDRDFPVNSYRERQHRDREGATELPARPLPLPQLPAIKATSPLDTDLLETSKARTRTKPITREEENKEIADQMRQERMDRILQTPRELFRPHQPSALHSNSKEDQTPKADSPVESVSREREPREPPAQLPARPVSQPRVPSITVTAPLKTDVSNRSKSKPKKLTPREEENKEIADKMRKKRMDRIQQTPRELFRAHQPSAQAARTPSEEAIRKVLF